MDDLIKRKDAIDALGEEPLVWDEWTDEYNKGMRTLWAVAKRDIESLPSIDAVPVIRCKDCKYGEVDDPDFPDQYYCHSTGFTWNEGDFFCADGERKEE